METTPETIVVDGHEMTVKHLTGFEVVDLRVSLTADEWLKMVLKAIKSGIPDAIAIQDGTVLFERELTADEVRAVRKKYG